MYIKDGRKKRGRKRDARKMYFCVNGMRTEETPFHVFNIRQIEEYPKGKKKKKHDENVY